MGRDALLSCVVDNLGQHQVAWIHLDREMILSIHKHVVIRQSRFHVTHDNHKTWTLHIAQVTLDDHGTYMCQVNSEKMISQVGYLKVVVPPDINDTVSSPSGIVVKEGDNVTMLCRGQGFPQPDIKWKREGGTKIKVDGGREVTSFAGETLTLKKTSRTDMGAYLCIASNGVPPSVSKRIMLQVEFAPMMHVPNQLVAYPVTREARLECFVEAHPRAITYWEYNENMVMNNSRIRTQTYEKDYMVKMLLIMHNLSRSDMGMYKCIAKNSIGETNGSITLHVVDLITQPPNTKGTFEDYRNRDDLISKKKGHGKVTQALDLDHDIRREQRLQHLDPVGKENEMERRRLEDESRRSQELQRLDHDQHYTKGHVQDPPANEATQLGLYSPSKLLVVSLFLSFILDSFRSLPSLPRTKYTRKNVL
ncbi:lachesin-like isoform X2 [Oratosquilla oratoria]|uniref:lachesin-like isoform X2 n=1 Tax=Oratosquilla oratoria TaxID=337810 RepID=UPI003F772B90